MEAKGLEQSIVKLGAYNPPVQEKLIDVNFLNYQLSSDVIKRKLHVDFPAECRVSQTVSRIASDHKVHGLQLTTAKLRLNHITADVISPEKLLYFIDDAKTIYRVLCGSLV